jgi:hypothetical protein
MVAPRKTAETDTSSSEERFTMGQQMIVRYLYFDETYPYSLPRVYMKRMVDICLERVKRKESIAYGQTCLWLYDALDKYSIVNKNVAIIGSNSPWLESICLYYGGKPTTIEYNRIISLDKRLNIMTVHEYHDRPQLFDAAFSISSFEHDGLGRYGDPINPDGDLAAMSQTKKMLKESGLLFLSVPAGRDTLVWNAHRIYGRCRLPLLLNGWKILDTYGLTDASFEKSEIYPTEPVFVLQNQN